MVFGLFGRGRRNGGGEREGPVSSTPSPSPSSSSTALVPRASSLKSSRFGLSESRVPLLVRRREPVWLNANRILGQRLRMLSRRLASVSSNKLAGDGGGEKQTSSSGTVVGGSAKPGDQVLASIPDGDAIARRLKDVPVYTVTSNENFVLLQEEDTAVESEAKSMLMLFMSANDARNFKETVVDKQSMLKPIIGTLFMDKVFKLHMQARPKELENVALRLMPDRAQVRHAFSTCEETGRPLTALPGVPIFQAEGLTMRSGDRTMIPLFFGKEELDFALTQAFGKPPVTPAVAYKRQWFSRQKERVDEVAKTPFPFLYQKIWKEDDEKAKAHIQKLEKKQAQLNEVKPERPVVQVGSFEDVLFRMLYEKDPMWENVMFIPQNTTFK